MFDSGRCSDDASAHSFGSNLASFVVECTSSAIRRSAIVYQFEFLIVLVTRWILLLYFTCTLALTLKHCTTCRNYCSIRVCRFLSFPRFVIHSFLFCLVVAWVHSQTITPELVHMDSLAIDPRRETESTRRMRNNRLKFIGTANSDGALGEWATFRRSAHGWVLAQNCKNACCRWECSTNPRWIRCVSVTHTRCKLIDFPFRSHATITAPLSVVRFVVGSFRVCEVLRCARYGRIYNRFDWCVICSSLCNRFYFFLFVLCNATAPVSSSRVESRTKCPIPIHICS